MTLTSWASAALVFLAVALGAVGLALLLEVAEERRRRRQVVRQLRALESLQEERGGGLGGLLRGAMDAEPGRIRALLIRIPRVRDLSLLLEQAGLATTAESLLLMCLGLGFGVGIATLIVTRFPAVAAGAGVAAAYAPIWYVRWKRAKRFAAFEAGLPDAIDLLGRAIRAGHPLSAGLKMVAEETRDPIAAEFRRTFEEQRFGIPFDDAVVALADRVNLVDVRILVTAILVQREIGGNLAELLDNLATVIRARFTIRRQLRVYTAQGRFSGYTLAVLPIVVGTLIYLLNPSYMRLLFTHPLGRFMLVTAAVLQLLGYLWIRRIVDIEI